MIGNENDKGKRICGECKAQGEATDYIQQQRGDCPDLEVARSMFSGV